jgi:hypothetical protein
MLAAGRVLGHTEPVEERERRLRGRYVGASRKSVWEAAMHCLGGKPAVVFDRPVRFHSTGKPCVAVQGKPVSVCEVPPQKQTRPAFWSG